jgi:iron complex transport system ATP-binding protein
VGGIVDNAGFALSGVSFAYGARPVLHGLDIALAPGRLYGIIGPNGSGKSTLLHLLAGHLAPSQGTVTLNHRSVAAYPPGEFARLCALVAQESAPNFPFTVYEAVLMGRHPHIPRFARPADTDLARVEHALAAMELGELRDRPLAALSGGERQRTAVARGLAQDAPALLLDEPTSAMDIRHAMATMAELARLAREEGRTVVTVLHDLNLAARNCDFLFMLDKGTVHAYGNVSRTLTPENIHAVFGVRAAILNTESGPHLAYL